MTTMRLEWHLLTNYFFGEFAFRSILNVELVARALLHHQKPQTLCTQLGKTFSVKWSKSVYSSFGVQYEKNRLVYDSNQKKIGHRRKLTRQDHSTEAGAGDTFGIVNYGLRLGNPSNLGVTLSLSFYHSLHISLCKVLRYGIPKVLKSVMTDEFIFCRICFLYNKVSAAL